MAVSQLHGQPAALSDPKFWFPGGPVNAILATNSTVYIGGDFSYVGPHTGPVVLFDQAAGGLQAAPPRIGGLVKAVVPDGAGGWFIGGVFTNVGSVAITNVAHLNSDLTLDTTWNAKLVGTTVNALALDSGHLFIGGTFTKINGLALSGGLAGVGLTSPTVNWNPLLSGTVNAMQVVGGLIYVGGSFSSVGSSNVQNVAAISTSAALATSFNPSTVDQPVLALCVSGTNVFVGGQFTTIGTKSKNRLAALDLNVGLANAWNPNPNGIVRALFVTATNAYVGGDFTTISVASRNGFASIGLTGTGTAQSLNLALFGSTVNLVRSILLQGNSLYVGGQFTNALAAPHYLIVGMDITSNQAIPTPLATDFNGPAGAAYGANALASANGNVLVGGDFQSMGGVARQRAAALSMTTGTALPWSPGFDAPVLSMAYGTNRIYVGGIFTNYYNITNPLISKLGQGLAAVDPVSGNPITFNFLGTNNAGIGYVSINSLALSSNALYAGGAFTLVQGQARRYVAALDQGSGNLIAGFNANLAGGSSGVSSLVLSGTNLYVGGDFTTVNSLAVPRLADVSSVNGADITWAPTPNQAVTTMTAAGGVLYVGGLFTSINLNGSGAISLNYFAAFSLADNSLVPIDASLPSGSTVNGIGATPTAIYVGGSFTAIGGNFTQNLGDLSSVDASTFGWNPSPDVGPSAFALTDTYAFVGGSFRIIGQAPTNFANGFFAAYQRTPQLRLKKSTPGNIELDFTTGDRSSAVLLGTTNLNNAVWNVLQTYGAGFGQSLILPVTPPRQFFRVEAQ